jgi:hypothetical protein
MNVSTYDPNTGYRIQEEGEEGEEVGRRISHLFEAS